MLSVPAASSLGSCVVLSITTVANGTFGLRVWLCGCAAVWLCVLPPAVAEYLIVPMLRPAAVTVWDDARPACGLVRAFFPWSQTVRTSDGVVASPSCHQPVRHLLSQQGRHSVVSTDLVYLSKFAVGAEPYSYEGFLAEVGWAGCDLISAWYAFLVVLTYLALRVARCCRQLGQHGHLPFAT